MINKAILLGRVGKDPELKTIGNGDMATFSLATSKKYSDSSGQKKEKTEWHNCVVFGKRAGVIKQYVQKGTLLYVEGEIQYQKIQSQDGVDKFYTSVNVGEFNILSWAERPAQSPAGESQW